MRVKWKHFRLKKNLTIRLLCTSLILVGRCGCVAAITVATNALPVHKVCSTGTRAKCYGGILISKSPFSLQTHFFNGRLYSK